MASLRSFSRRKPRIAFVLSGGGNLGALQIGMLKALAERGIVPDVVLGCSVGALNGAGYAAEPTPEGVAHLERTWRSSLSESIMPSSRIPSSVQLIRRGESLHTNTGLRASIEVFLRGRTTFADLDVPFQCVATDVSDATERWFTEGELVEPILASAALPSVYPMVTIGGRRYIDGGVVDNVPISRAVELGARQIYVLHVGPHGRPGAEVRRPLDAALIAYWIARNSRFASELARLPRSVEAIVLPCGTRPEIRFDDFSQTGTLIELGHTNAAEYLDRVAAEDAAGDSAVVARLRADRLAEDARRVAAWLREWSVWPDGARDAVIDGAVADGDDGEGELLDRALAAGALDDDGPAHPPLEGQH